MHKRNNLLQAWGFGGPIGDIVVAEIHITYGGLSETVQSKQITLCCLNPLPYFKVCHRQWMHSSSSLQTTSLIFAPNI